MYLLQDAHFLTVIIVVASIMVTPFYLLATYVFSGASPQKGGQAGAAFLIWGSFMIWVCLSGTPPKLGLPGNLIVPLAWVLPSLILFPTGMIPLFLVPYAIFFHTFSILNYWSFER